MTDYNSAHVVNIGTASICAVSGVITLTKQMCSLLTKTWTFLSYTDRWKCIFINYLYLCICVHQQGSADSIFTSWGSTYMRRPLDSQQGASACRCYTELPDPLHSWTRIVSNQLCVDGYNAHVKVCSSQWILTGNLQAMRGHMMNINQQSGENTAK